MQIDSQQAQMLERARQGNHAAFSAFIEAYVPTIRRFALALERNPDDADDLAQDALLRIFKSLPGFRHESSFSTWCYRVVRNTAVDRSRLRWFRLAKQSVQLIAADSDRPDPTTPESLSIERHRKALLWQCIGQLPVKLRTCLVLIDIEGLTYDEVSLVEQVPIGTVRSRLSRAREKLKDLVKNTSSDASDASAVQRSAS